jgi:hypothetical protein
MFSPKKVNSATTCKGFIVQEMDFNQKTTGYLSNQMWRFSPETGRVGMSVLTNQHQCWLKSMFVP